MPMGDYYVWHCDWCDSTNYTLWARMEREGLACTACHQHNTVCTEHCNGYEHQGATADSLMSIAL